MMKLPEPLDIEGAEGIDRLLDPVSESRVVRASRDKLMSLMVDGDGAVDEDGHCLDQICIGRPVDINGRKIRIFTSLDRALDEIRELEGEDPFTGNVPVLEHVMDVEVDILSEKTERPVIYEYSEGEKTRLLSRIPALALDALFERLYGYVWWEIDPVVIFEDLAEMTRIQKGALILDGGGLNKVNALHALLAAPSDSSPFYEDMTTFLQMALWLSGREQEYGPYVLPTPLEISVAFDLAVELRPEVYATEVLAAAAVSCFQEGYWCLPSNLAVLQPHIYRMCRAMGVPVDEERCDRVKDLVQKFKDDPDPNRTPLNRDEAQALRYMDMEVVIARELRLADLTRDKVLNESTD